MENHLLINQLFESRKLSSRKECEQFEKALFALQTSISINDTGKICKVFCDDTGDDEVMFGLVHLIEQLQGDEYLKHIAICSPDMTDAHDWAMTLNKRMLNSQKYFNKYLEIINDMEEFSKSKIIKLLIDVKNDNPNKFSEKVDCILEEIG